MRGFVLGGLIALACAVAAGGIAATGWTVYRDHPNGFQVAAPTGWIMVPGSRPAALKLATAFEKKGEVRQATLVRSYLANNDQSGEDRVVDGIQYPIQTSPILTDFFFVKDHLPKGLQSDSNTLHYIADSLFSGLATRPGVKMTTRAPVRLSLHGGNSVEFAGTIPAAGFGGRRTGFVFYFFLGPGDTEWQIEFRTDSGKLSADAALFRRIADSLAFI